MNRLSRRALLRGAGAAALSLPLLELMGAEAMAQSASLPKRLIFFSIPLGFGGALNDKVDPFWPTGTETQFNLGGVLAPLAPHQSQVLVLKNLGMKMGTGIQGHDATVGQLFAGVEGVGGAYPVRPEAGQTGAGITLDHYLASQLPATPFKTLYLRAGNSDYFPCSYTTASTPFQPTCSPQKAFDDLFKNFNPGQGSAAAQAAAREAKRKQSVIDSVKGDFAKLNTKLGATDKAKLDAHLTSIRSIESRLAAATPSPMTCTVPTQSLPSGAPASPTNGSWGANNVYWMNDNQVPAASDLHIDLLVSALACDLTRVAVFEHQCFTQAAAMPWLGISNMHDLSHDGSTDNINLQVKGYSWYAGQLAKLITKLKAVPEGNGTLFDNTGIVWVQELSCGNHDMHNQPTLIAGTMGGHFRSGRFVTYPGFPDPYPDQCCGSGSNPPGQHLMNDLHLTLIDAMGLPLPPGGTFGRPAWCTGILPNLT